MLALIQTASPRTFIWGEMIPLLAGLGLGVGYLFWGLFLMRKHPAGLRPLFMTEMWERFSYYGMRALLTLYMVAPPDKGGLGFSPAKATMIYGTYGAGVYLLSLPGGWLADRFLGYRRAVFMGGIILALGHLALAFHPLPFFYGGMVLIIVGTGLLKTNCTSLVGMLYEPGDHRQDAGYSIYYMGINLGAFISPLICVFLGQSQTFLWALDKVGVHPAFGWHWGFAAAGVAMVVGLVQLKFQQHRLGETGILPAKRTGTEAQKPVDEALRARLRPMAILLFTLLGSGIVGFFLIGVMGMAFWHGAVAGAVLGALFGYSNWDYLDLARDEKMRVGAVGLLFVFSVIFWAIFEQAGTTLSIFAENHTNRVVPGLGAFPAGFYQSVNSFFIISLAPIFSVLWVFLGTREPSSPIKFTIGVMAAGLGFALLLPTMAAIGGGAKVSAWWLVGTYFIHTIGELCLSPVGLSTTSRLAPKKFAGLMMGVWFLSIGAGYKVGGFAGHLVEKYSLGSYLMGAFAITVMGSVVLLLLTPTIKRMMGDEPIKGAH